MDITDLRIFEAVSRHGGMSHAAERLNTVQSNVTTRIRHLEAELGVSLFQRSVRGARITPAGERLLPFATRILRLMQDAEAAARDVGAPSGVLHIGSLETTAALRLSPILARYAALWPKVRLDLVTETTQGLIEQVALGRLEGAFVAGPVRHPDLHHETVFEEELVLITAPRTPARLDELPDLRMLVFRSGCSYRQRLETYLAAQGVTSAQPMALGSLDAIIACVGAGIGVSLLPRGVVEAARREGRIAAHALPPAEAWVETVFIHRRDGYISSAMTALLDMAKTDFSEAAAADSPADRRR